MKKNNLIGKRFGRWVVLSAAPRSYQTMWNCKCACGVERTVSAANLSTGKSTSCGCFREENRPNLVKNRDYYGRHNPRAKLSIKRNDGVWVPSSSIWYKRASGVFYSAKKHGVPIEFTSVAEFASFLVGIAPTKCPVFEVEFIERGNGFNNWSPSIDKIIPEIGYMRGNIQVISMLANRMKTNASQEQLSQFAHWVLGDKV